MAKVDSLIRGNIREELTAARQALSLEMIVLAPAIPRLDRRVVDGRVLYPHGEPIAICEKLEGLRVARLRTGTKQQINERIAHALRNRVEVLVADAETDDDLTKLVNAGSEHRSVLWAGAGGLAMALAAQRHGASIRPHPCRPNLPLLICVGSDHAATRSQLERLRQAAQADLFSAGDRAYDAVTACLRGGRSAVLLFAEAQFAPASLRAFADKLDLRACGALMLTGGDTAAAILRELEIDRVRIQAHLLPGVPWGKVIAGKHAGLTLITKSGAFGNPDCLLDCIRMCSATDANLQRGEHE